LRHQPVHRQAPRLGRGDPGAAAGGRLGVSDVIAGDGTDPAQRTEAEQQVGCLNGTLTQAPYHDLLRAAGFTGVIITLTYDAAPGLHAAIIPATKPGTLAG
jgi:hypothetical protein